MIPQAPRKLVESKALAGWRADGNETALPKVYVLAVRAYYSNTFAPPGNNTGVYDDAFFLVTPNAFKPLQANTDASKIGWNPGVGKPYGLLKPGVWWFYPGPHKGKLPAFRQADDADVAKKFGIPHDGKFHVTRMWGDGDPRNYDEWGHQQVNIHLGGNTGTSSWLCLTVPPSTGRPWLQAATDALKIHGQKLLPVILVNGPIN